MLNTTVDIAGEFLLRMNQSSAMAFYADATILQWYNEAHYTSAAEHFWPFTENVDTSITFAAGTEIYARPANIKSFSTRILTVGTNPAYLIDKYDFESYVKFRELVNTASDRAWTEFANNIYINPNLDVSGVVTLYSQKNPSQITTMNDSGNTSVFTNREEEGNDGIVEFMQYLAYSREKNPEEARLHLDRWQAVMDKIWKRITDEMFAFKPKDRGMWKRFNVIKGNTINDFSNNQDLSNRWL